MLLTPEQDAILATTGSICIHAVAGSGKTTTLLQYARTRPAGSRILYLAFNRSVKVEAERKFRELGLHRVQVDTAHSLAYRFIIPYSNYQIAKDGYKIYELAELLGISGGADPAAAYIVANHVNRFAAYFCNSAALRVQDLNYTDTVHDEKAKEFVRRFYTAIEGYTRLFLKKMNDGEIGITHDFYLKKFGLSNPVLVYDYILFDEAQDASPVMTELFLRQPAVKVMVGDPHQQIYSWRYAVNAMAAADFPALPLSTSFRFPEGIARLGVAALGLKSITGEHQPVVINGRGSSADTAVRAILARTNLGLLLKAIAHITGPQRNATIYFEGNIASYTYADEGASVWDVLSLYNDNHDRIRDRLIGSMASIEALEEYVDKTDDRSMGMLVAIVKEYNNRLPGLIAQLKERHQTTEDRHKAKYVFSTVHRAKGMEYDEVELAADFITEERLTKLKEKKDTKEGAESWHPARLNEEINLLYVALTRARTRLYIPEEIMIENLLPFDCIAVLQAPKPEPVTKAEVIKNEYLKKRLNTKISGVAKGDKAYDVEAIREKNPSSYKPWTPEADEALRQAFKSGVSKDDLCEMFGRNAGAIFSRLKKLGLAGVGKQPSSDD